VFDTHVAQYELACFTPTSPNCTAYSDTFCTEWLGVIAQFRTNVLLDLGNTNVVCSAVDGSDTCRYLNNINDVNYDRDVLTCYNAISEWEITTFGQFPEPEVNCETVGNSIVCDVGYDTGM
jgi:hypothetical protein